MKQSIKATDLRIGNYVKIRWVITNVQSMDLDGTNLITKDVHYAGPSYSIVSPRFNFKQISGIPLTTNWLLKLGFEKWYEPNTLGIDAWHKGEDAQRFDLMYKDNMIYLKCRYVAFNKHHQSMPKIQYVHQLQNLYHALTGEELIINN